MMNFAVFIIIEASQFYIIYLSELSLGEEIKIDICFDIVFN